MNLFQHSTISKKLAAAGPTSFSIYCIAAAFGTYFCMYAFRKPFTADTFEQTDWLGLGMYIPYVAFHTTIFERMIASFREIATIGYLMYLADAVGYLGCVGVMFFRNTVSGDVDFLDLLIWISVVSSIVSSAIALLLWIYYYKTIPHEENQLDLIPAKTPVET